MKATPIKEYPKRKYLPYVRRVLYLLGANNYSKYDVLSVLLAFIVAVILHAQISYIRQSIEEIANPPISGGSSCISSNDVVCSSVGVPDSADMLSAMCFDVCLDSLVWLSNSVVSSLAPPSTSTPASSARKNELPQPAHNHACSVAHCKHVPAARTSQHSRVTVKFQHTLPLLCNVLHPRWVACSDGPVGGLRSMSTPHSNKNFQNFIQKQDIQLNPRSTSSISSSNILNNGSNYGDVYGVEEKYRKFSEYGAKMHRSEAFKSSQSELRQYRAQIDVNTDEKLVRITTCSQKAHIHEGERI